MRSRGRILFAVSAVAVLFAALVVGRAAAGAGASATLTGEAEVPGPGDRNGSGSASITLDRATGTVCFELDWSHIRGPWGAHIHRGGPDEAGPIVVSLFQSRNLTPLPRSIKGVTGCVRGVDADLIDRIANNPSRYYVNVHTKDFPGGAIRGQLGSGV
ncbi:MAG TPA: CHRD domain-containing protein [Actinomycetota bacterium]|nr:CHRD domain-containing protein [Actinomycetota bacterium]